MYDFWRKSLVKMKKALCNCFKEIFDRLLYYGMNCNPHWNKNFEAASPQASDCTSQFVTWFNLVNILWKGMNHTESALRGAAAKPPRFIILWNNILSLICRKMYLFHKLVKSIHFSLIHERCNIFSFGKTCIVSTQKLLYFSDLMKELSFSHEFCVWKK